MPFDYNKPRRKEIRLRGYDYSRDGLYYVTICTKDRKCLFGEIKDGEMHKNEYGQILESVWNDLPSHYTNIVLHEHIVMPDHFHAIIQIDNGRVGGNASVGGGLKPSPTDTQPSESGMQPTKHGLAEFVRALKTFSARKINELRKMQGTPVWQRNYYEHIIRNDDDYCRTVNYIKENPARWGSEESLEK